MTEIQEAKKAILTYEDYYNIDDGVLGGLSGNRNLSDKGKISYEQFVSQTASENIFDNDVSKTCKSHIILVVGATIQVLGIS